MRRALPALALLAALPACRDGAGQAAAPEPPKPVQVAEIRFVDFPAGKPRIVGYEAKWKAGSFEYEHTPRDFALSRAEWGLTERIGNLARECWRAFGLRGYARVDLRIDDRGEPWILEVNANPCLSSDAGFAAAVAEEGLSFEDAIARIVQAALEPAG